jgi:spermidine dehydrogenase
MPSISRRDFLNGVALTVASGLTPAAQIAAEPSRYPPALTGLRGQHAGSFETAHAQAREGKRFALDSLPVEERYDLVVVGGGIRRIVGRRLLSPRRRAVCPHPRPRQPR